LAVDVRDSAGVAALVGGGLVGNGGDAGSAGIVPAGVCSGSGMGGATISVFSGKAVGVFFTAGVGVPPQSPASNNASLLRSSTGPRLITRGWVKP